MAFYAPSIRGHNITQRHGPINKILFTFCLFYPFIIQQYRHVTAHADRAGDSSFSSPSFIILPLNELENMKVGGGDRLLS